jgi:hypothetical protein
MAKLLFVPVKQFELIPKYSGSNNVKLGSVTIAVSDPIRNIVIGIAPLLFGLCILISSFLLVNNFQPEFTALFLTAWAYGIFQISTTMFLSDADLQGAWKVGLVILILGIGYYFYNLPVPDFGGFFSGTTLNLIQRFNMILLITLILEVLVFVILWCMNQLFE